MDDNNSIVVKQIQAPSTPEVKGKSKHVTISAKLPILYTDAAYIMSNKFGVGPTDQQNVVARLGMSVEQAEVLVNTISKALATKAQPR
jgi:hypothetical protein